MGKGLIAIRATPEQQASLKELAKRTGKTQTDLLLDGLNNASELDRLKSENMTLKLGSHSGKAPDMGLTKSLGNCLTTAEHHTLKVESVKMGVSMGMAFRKNPTQFLTAELPDLDTGKPGLGFVDN